MTEEVNAIPVVQKSRRGGNRIYTDADKQMVRDRYNSGQSVAFISEKTGIHEATIYKYCADLVKAANRRSTGRKPTIQFNTVFTGLKNKLTQAQIAEQAGVSRQAVCLFIGRHKEALNAALEEAKTKQAEMDRTPIPRYVGERHGICYPPSRREVAR